MDLLNYGSFLLAERQKKEDYKYNGGEWSDARFHSFIKGGLRSISQRWPPKYKALNKAYVGRKINPKTGREAKHYECVMCVGHFPLKDVEVNHKESVIPFTGFDSWDNVIKRLFCEQDGLEVLCKSCHKDITALEKSERKYGR